jgi:hypothetical protein
MINYEKTIVSIGLFMLPHMAQSPIPPPDAIRRQVTIGIICLPTVMRIVEVLGERFGEAIVASGELGGGSSFYIFANAKKSSSSIVISKPDSACLVWSGRSAEGMAFMLAAEPIDYPEMVPPAPSGTET